MKKETMILYRDLFQFVTSLCFVWLYFPHLLILFFSANKRIMVYSDVRAAISKECFFTNIVLQLIFLLHNNRYFRTLFYHRIGAIPALLIGWYRPGDRYFIISKTTIIKEGAYFAHPYATVINAESIGKNFSCRHLTTLGNKNDGANENRPIIGDNVNLGANVTIIGGVRIGNNVTIGAGSVVVKDIPDNAIAVGNPARVIRYKADINS